MDKYIFVIGTILLASTRAAHAYIDPGTGSMIIQAIIGVVLAGTLTFKIWVGKLKEFMNRKNKDQEAKK